MAVITTYCYFKGLDGYAARKLNQISVFGAWLDVVVDVIGRGMLWSNISKVMDESTIGIILYCLLKENMHI